MSVEFWLRQNKEVKKLNCLTCPCHETYESALCRTGHNFYAIRTNGVKDWDTTYRPLPQNYTLLDKNKQPLDQLPPDVSFDIVLSQNKFGQYQILAPIANQLGIPLCSLEHTLPTNKNLQSKAVLEQLKMMSGFRNVFISEYSRDKWGYTEADVIHHGIDTEQFTDLGLVRNPTILTVVNDWINRGPILGYDLYRQITQGLPVCPVGATPGLSRPAKNVDELVNFYNTSQIFLNTSIISPIPMSMLESMSCRCAVISTNTCMIPEIIKNGVNGFISNNPAELRYYLELCLGDEKLRRKLGEAARQTILDRFNLTDFVNNWNNLFYSTVRDFR